MGRSNRRHFTGLRVLACAALATGFAAPIPFAAAQQPPGFTLQPAIGSQTPVPAPQERYVQQDGMLFREVRYVERRPVTKVEWVEHTEPVTVEQYTTAFRPEARQVEAPAVDYYFQPTGPAVTDGPGGAVLPGYWVPYRKWESRTETVRVPVTQRQLVTENRTVRMPVRHLEFVDEEKVARVPADGSAPGAATPWGAPATPAPTPAAPVSPHAVAANKGSPFTATPYPTTSGLPPYVRGGSVRMTPPTPSATTASAMSSWKRFFPTPAPRARSTDMNSQPVSVTGWR